MSGPLISVVLPTRNRAPLVVDAVQSVLQQTYARLELIVVDDGSTDDTLARLDAIKDPRLRILTLPQSRGAAGARNPGIDAAQGEWIAFQDSDDLWLPDKLRQQVECARTLPPEYVGVYTSYWRVDGTTRDCLPRPGPGLDGAVLDRLLQSNFITIQTLMVRRHLAQRIGGFDVTLAALADWDFAIRLAQCGSIRWIAAPLVEYRLQLDSTTRLQDKFVASYLQMMEKHHEIMVPDSRAEAWHLATIGNRLCREGARCRGRSFLWRSLRLQPLDIRYAGAWVVSWLPVSFFRTLTRCYARLRS